MAALLQQLARPSSHETNESREDNASDYELPPAKKIRKDSEFCGSGSVSIHANDDNHHSLDGEKNSARGVTAAGCRMLRTNKTRATKLLDILAESLGNTDSVTDNVKPQLAHIANKHWVKRLTPEKLKPILDKHKQPANFSDVVNSRVNPEFGVSFLRVS